MADQERVHLTTDLDEDTALAILFANTRRKKRTDDLLRIAESCEYLVDLYGSQRAVSRKVGLSEEMIRQFRTVLKLPIEVRRLVQNRQIDSIDIVKEIASLRDHSKQIAMAESLADTPSKEVRDIKRLVKYGYMSARGAKQLVKDAKPKKLNVFVMDFDEITSRRLEKAARARRTKEADLVRDIVSDWLKKNG